MDILKQLDRQLLMTEIYDIVRFNLDVKRGYGYNPINTKISLLRKDPHISFRLPVYVIPYDDSNRKFIILNDSRVIEIERITNNTHSIRLSICMDPYKWHTFTSYSNPSMFDRLKAIYNYCIKELSETYKNVNYAEGAYNYEKYVKSI